jgi:hypothetical protein
MATNGTASTTGDLLEVPSGVARLRYFYGQLLTQRDLSAEQGYHLLLRRLMQREAFGTGTVSGLKVDATGAGAPDCVTVRAGLALDPDGRELLLVRDVSIKVAEDAVSPSTATPYITGTTGSLTAADIAPQVVTAWGASFDPLDVQLLSLRFKEAGLTGASADDVLGDLPFTAGQLNMLTPSSPVALAPGQLLRDYLFDAIVGTTYLGLRYVERGKEPSPAVLDGSCCGETACFPARLEENVVIVGQSTPFSAIVDPYAAAKATIENDLLAQEIDNGLDSGSNPILFHDADAALYDYVLGTFRGLPPSDDPCGAATPPAVPLARVSWSRFLAPSGESRILSVDNRTFRPLAPGVPPVRALLEVLTRSATTSPIQPRFDLISPANRSQITVSGSTAVASARSTSPLNAIDPATWEVYFYPASPAGPAIHWNATTAPTAPYSFTISADTTVVDGRTYVRLIFDAGSPTPLTLPSGTYVWRLNVDAGLQATVTGAILDGLPEPPNVVPTGDDNPTTYMPFEAVFYVP